MQEAGDLNRILDAMRNKKFHGEYKPQKVFANNNLQIVCIPYEDGGYEMCERRDGKESVLIPALSRKA